MYQSISLGNQVDEGTPPLRCRFLPTPSTQSSRWTSSLACLQGGKTAWLGGVHRERDVPELDRRARERNAHRHARRIGEYAFEREPPRPPQPRLAPRLSVNRRLDTNPRGQRRIAIPERKIQRREASICTEIELQQLTPCPARRARATRRGRQRPGAESLMRTRTALVLAAMLASAACGNTMQADGEAAGDVDASTLAASPSGLSQTQVSVSGSDATLPEGASSAATAESGAALTAGPRGTPGAAQTAAAGAIDARGITDTTIAIGIGTVDVAALTTAYAPEAVPPVWRVNETIDVDSNGGLVIGDLSHHGATWMLEFATVAPTERLRRAAAAADPLMVLADPDRYSALGALGLAHSSTYQDEKNAYRFDVPSGMTGLLVQRVEPMSAAQEAGIERGQIILEVNRQHVDSVAGLRRVLERTRPGDALAVFIYIPEIEQTNIRTVRMDPR